MAILSFKSPGVSTKVVDLTSPTAILPAGIPAGVISTTQKGPAYVPVTLPTLNDWRVVFGNPIPNIKFGPLSAVEWFRTQQALTQLRVLGIGDGTKRTDSGLNKGKVTSAGFVVGEQQPQSTLSGALGDNVNANATSSSPDATGSAGRLYFLGCIMSQSAGSNYFTDAGLINLQSYPVVRGVLMAASGVIIQLSSSNTSSLAPSSTAAADFSAGTVQGSFTGSVKLSASLQEFVMLLNGHKGTNLLYPNVLTASFDPTAPNYFGTVFNRDPIKLEDAGYLLYAHWDVFSGVAVPSGSGVVLGVSGANVSGSGYENIAFVITGSQTTNSGSTTAPNYENFEDRYQTAHTPWIVSQIFGGKPENLFRVWALSDGQEPNTQLKLSIENISPSVNDNNLFGTFDVVLRNFGDTDGNRVIIEQFRGVNLDPSSDRYIARIIGDIHAFFNWDANEDSQKINVNGDFESRSKYIRVEMNPEIDAGEVDPTAIPMGFRGPQHLITSGTAPLPAFSDTNYYSVTNIFNRVTEIPVPFRLSLSKGVTPNKSSDKSLYWGVQFEQVTSPTEPNSSTAPNRSMYSFTKYFPNFQTEYMNFVVSDNQGTPDTAENGILDADRFNNNLFSLERVKIVYNTTSSAPVLSQLQNWSYVRSGNIPTDVTSATRALTVADLTDPSVRSVAKFTTYFMGGFDGTRIFNHDTVYLTNNAIVEEVGNASRGFSSGPTAKSYIRAVDIMKDNLEVDIQLLTTPGIRHELVTDYAIAAIQNDRFDCFYIFDIEERDTFNNLVTNPDTQNISVRFTATNFTGRGLNSSFAGAYFPDVNINDEINQTIERVPPSVAVLGAFGNNDAVGHPWFAPAGFNRAALNSVREATVALSRANLDDLYSQRINPIVAFPQQGPTVWGQKTVLGSQSALERINVRRMLLSVRREVKKVSNQILFEPNREATLAQFSALVDPILKRVQDQGGVSEYSVQINTETTTQADIENKIIRGKIFVVPTRSLEFLDLTFVVTNRANFSITG